MTLVKRRLTSLWRHRTGGPAPPRPWPTQYPDSRMLVTIKEPLQISGLVLVPGQYEFRLMDPEAESHHLQIFTGDQTQLVATFPAL